MIYLINTRWAGQILMIFNLLVHVLNSRLNIKNITMIIMIQTQKSKTIRSCPAVLEL